MVPHLPRERKAAIRQVLHPQAPYGRTSKCDCALLCMSLCLALLRCCACLFVVFAALLWYRRYRRREMEEA